MALGISCLFLLCRGSGILLSRLSPHICVSHKSMVYICYPNQIFSSKYLNLQKTLIKKDTRPSLLLCFLGLWNCFPNQNHQLKIFLRFSKEHPQKKRIQHLVSFRICWIVYLTMIISSIFLKFPKGPHTRGSRLNLFWCFLGLWNCFPNQNHQLKLILKFP
jgi:hypothetical protein